MYFHSLFNRGVWAEDPFFVYKPKAGETVYHETVTFGMDEKAKSAIPHSVQPKEKDKQFYVIVDGNHRYVVWKEL